MLNRGGRPTVLDVAKRAGVSPSTVSRHLRNLPNVSKENGLLIDAAVGELGYVPNELARGLRGGRTNTIGLVMPSFANAFFSQVAQVIEREAQARGYNVMLLTHGEQLTLQDSHLLTLRRYRIDGILIAAAPDSETDHIRQLAEPAPIVCFDRMLPRLDSITTNNRSMAHTATEHLLAHGYHNIIAVTFGPPVQTIDERILGYKDKMRAAGLPIKICSAMDDGCLRSFLASSSKSEPCAFLSLSNLGTVQILMQLRDLPDLPSRRIFMIGFDDLSLAALLDPPLTVVLQPTEEIGRKSLQLLLDRIGAKRAQSSKPHHYKLSGRLLIRSSCGCAEPQRR